MTRLKTCGDYPPELYRFFKEREHADQFLAGSIRFGLLDYYKTLEDQARKDAAEGKGSFRAPSDDVTTVHVKKGKAAGVTHGPGEIHHIAEIGNPIYIVSCVDPREADIEALKKKFGPFVVRIDDPKQLGQDITDAISGYDKTHPLAGSLVECAKVVYDKGRRRESEPSQDERLKSAYTQKSEDFADEHENRLVVFSRLPIKKDDAEHNITVELGHPLEYAELLGDE